MNTKIKHKTALVLLSGTLLSVASPAQAQAPRLTKQVKFQALALQEPKHYARIKMADYGWNVRQYVCLSNLWAKESHWNHKANNPKSTAFGIAQMLNETSLNPVTQINNGLRYIKHRYDLPCAAWLHWQHHSWY